MITSPEMAELGALESWWKLPNSGGIEGFDIKALGMDPLKPFEGFFVAGFCRAKHRPVRPWWWRGDHRIRMRLPLPDPRLAGTRFLTDHLTFVTRAQRRMVETQPH